jgi:phosphatidylinositol alpha-1,6-mannosyltransferase
MRILVLITDAFGGQGGIAEFNRNFIKALCNYKNCSEVVAIPRIAQNYSDELPQKLTYVVGTGNSKLSYIAKVLKFIFKRPKFDLIICGHINLLPIAYLINLRGRIPVTLVIHGIDAWQPTGRFLVDFLSKKIDAFIAVSEFTRKKFLNWTKLKSSYGFILPNSIDLKKYGPRPKNYALLNKYRLLNKTVLMTLGRLSSEERYKGIDEVLEVLPLVEKKVSNIAYLVVGDGTDRKRLEEKARVLGVKERVVFSGMVPENEKIDHYCLADVFVMPGRGEGFGIVYLEAMACGIPVVASKVDGSREAVMDGKLGIIVNPDNKDELIVGILDALKKEKGVVPKGLEVFSFNRFTEKLYSIMEDKNFLWRKSK